MSNKLKCINCDAMFDPAEQSPFRDFNCSYHTREPRSIGNTGPRGDYAELWYFPCCGKRMVGAVSNSGEDIKPAKSPGCTNNFHTAEPNKLFISYSRLDNKFAGFLERELSRRGFSVWKDKTAIIGGDDWKKMIEKAIEESSNFLLLLSHGAISSEEVRREIEIARNGSKPIIPILISDCEIPEDLARAQYIDWRKDQDFSYSGNFEAIREAVNRKRACFLQRSPDVQKQRKGGQD